MARYRGPLYKAGLDVMELDRDPGPRLVVEAPSADGRSCIERDYLDLNLLTDDMRTRVLAAAGIKTRRPSKFAQAKQQFEAGISGLRIGYSFWGFLGDHKISDDRERLSTPDGNATYSWSIVWEAMRRGHVVLPMMMDRDRPGVDQYGVMNFKVFAKKERTEVYRHLVKSGALYGSHYGFPELDLLLLEWRFPIPGRNTPDMVGRPGYQGDLSRQEQLLKHYLDKGTTVVVWDLDYKLTAEDEQAWGLTNIIETSINPRRFTVDRVRVEPPTVVDLLMEHGTRDASTLLCYIGSRYERDDVIDEWIRPISNRDAARGRIHFYGNWLKDAEEVYRRWPGVSFNDRVTLSDFHRIYRSAAGVPLLAKREYMERGFVTPRVWEALMFGSIPIGLQGHFGIELYTKNVARDAQDLLEIALRLHELSLEERDRERRESIEKIGFMDVRHFVDRLEKFI